MLAIRVLIVEDDPIITEDIKDMLTSVNYQVVATAYDKEEAFEAIDQIKPDLVLLDINLDGNYEGFEVAEYINKTRKIPFLYLTSYSGKEVIDKAKQTLPMGYIVKPFNERELFSSIEIALHNFSKFILPLELNRDIINNLIVNPLTQKEFDVLKGLYEGKTNQQLADEQFVSVNTIKTHIKNIYEKMDTHTRSETISLLNDLLH
ncbi:MAG: response regulator transcription factor [Flavobacteriaceae bacterium]|nr:response regulator transcription factor [Mangrovimonas sp.]MCB0432446.1 response regulator transcription factor [Mangrovimonas sp.]MCB0435555.1 response regulator transcription factor [Mangrovimonas sp.]HRV54429.1 response regulator transcription factor [Mangrovimonas sp.]